MQKRIWGTFAKVGESDAKQKAVWEAFEDEKLRKKNVTGTEIGFFSLNIALNVRLEREKLSKKLKKAIKTLENIAKTAEKEALRIHPHRLLGDLVEKPGQLLRDSGRPQNMVNKKTGFPYKKIK